MKRLPCCPGILFCVEPVAADANRAPVSHTARYGINLPRTGEAMAPSTWARGAVADTVITRTRFPRRVNH